MKVQSHLWLSTRDNHIVFACNDGDGRFTVTGKVIAEALDAAKRKFVPFVAQIINARMADGGPLFSLVEHDDGGEAPFVYMLEWAPEGHGKEYVEVLFGENPVKGEYDCGKLHGGAFINMLTDPDSLKALAATEHESGQKPAKAAKAARPATPAPKRGAKTAVASKVTAKRNGATKAAPLAAAGKMLKQLQSHAA